MALRKRLLNRRMVVLGFILLLWLVTGLPILRALLPQTTTIIGDADRSLLAGTLLYVQGEDGLWRVNLPDGEPHRWWYDETLTDISGVAASPTVHQLAVVAAPLPDDGLSMVGATQIYLMNPAGTTLTPLAQRERSNISYRDPVWSPDGLWLYYTHRDPYITPPVRRIERIDAHNLNAPPEIVYEGAEPIVFADDGARVAYIAVDPAGGAEGLLFDDGSGSPPRTLVEPGTFEAIQSPLFDPQKERIVFSASGEPGLLQSPASTLQGLCPRTPAQGLHPVNPCFCTLCVQNGKFLFTFFKK